MVVKKITPVLFVEEVEPCVKFWVERMGFQKTAEVPEGNKLGFAMLQKGSVELMYQSYASADKDVGVGAISRLVRKGPTFLYVEVESLDETIAAIKGAEVVMPVRTTFYSQGDQREGSGRTLHYLRAVRNRAPALTFAARQRAS